MRYEKTYGANEKETETNQRLEGLIRRAYEQTGRQVVVLIDEYDAPLLDVMHEEENLPMLRNVMRNFYSPSRPATPTCDACSSRESLSSHSSASSAN